MEFETKVETFRVDKQCERCKEGMMQCTGRGITTLKTSWEHVCDNCGFSEWFDEAYPSMRNRDIGKTKILKP